MLFSQVCFGLNKRIKQMFKKDEVIFLSERDAIMLITFLYWAIFVKFVVRYGPCIKGNKDREGAGIKLR